MFCRRKGWESRVIIVIIVIAVIVIVIVNVIVVIAIGIVIVVVLTARWREGNKFEIQVGIARISKHHRR